MRRVAFRAAFIDPFLGFGGGWGNRYCSPFGGRTFDPRQLISCRHQHCAPADLVAVHGAEYVVDVVERRASTNGLTAIFPSSTRSSAAG